MAGRRGGVTVPISTEFNNRGLEQANKQLNAFGKTVTKQFMGVGAAVGGAFAVTAIAGQLRDMAAASITAASRMQESQSKVNVVFGRSAGSIREWAETSSTAMVMSKQAALEAAGTYGNLFQAFGIGQVQATEMSKTLVQLAADLASFNNTSTEDAIQALRSGLSGETEPLKRYGVALNDARLKQEALNMGIYDGKGILDANQKAQAAYALILKDTALAQGDVARTSTNFANVTRAVSAAVDNASAAIGDGLVSGITSAAGALGGSQGLVNLIEGAGDGVANLTAGVGVLVENLGAMTAEMQKPLASREKNTIGDFLFNLRTFNPFQAVGFGISLIGENARIEVAAVQSLADELSRAEMMQDIYSFKTGSSAVALRDETKYANLATEAINKLNGALARRNGGQQGLIGSNIQLRKMRSAGVQSYAGDDKKLSMDERRQFGLDYAGIVGSKYDSLVDMGRLRDARRLLRNSRRFLNNQVGDGFGQRVLGTPPELNAAIAAKDKARSEAGANQWRSNMSVLNIETININADTPEDAIEKAKRFARLSAVGRGAEIRGSRGGALGLNPATGGSR